MDYGQKSHAKKHKRRQFLVDPARVELDEYMVAQIKKNKRSVKSLRKEVFSLRREVAKLQEQHDDYMLLEKTRTPDYSHSHQLKKTAGSNRISLLQQVPKCKHILEGKSLGKDNSLLSVSSSASSIASFKHTSKTKRNCSNLAPNSKSRLSKKIEELKSKALLQRERDKIRSEVKEKINCQVRAKLSKQLATEASRIETPSNAQHKQQQTITEDYQKLLDLLKTSRSKKVPQSVDPKDQPRVSQFQLQSQYKQSQLPKPQACNLESGHKLNAQPEQKKKGQSQTLNSANYLPFKSSTFLYQHQEQAQRAKEADDNIFRSQTNLLDSSPSHTPEESPRRPKRNLQFSRTVDVCIATEQSCVTEGSGNFQGLFGCAPVEVRSGTVEMSFEGGDNSKRRLRELQFEFDQLVRQQLIASDPREKQMLSQTIRSVLWSINQLKAKMSSKGSKDSG